MPRKTTVTGTAPKPASSKRTTKKKVSKQRPARRKLTETSRLSALDAAVRVLQEAGTALNCRELIESMAARQLWKSPQGKTPERTLYAAMQREIKHKGKESRFRQVERGRFALR